MSSVRVEPSDLEAMTKAKLVVEFNVSREELINNVKPLENVTVNFTPQENVKVEEIQTNDVSEITINFVPRACGQLAVDVQFFDGQHRINGKLLMFVKPQEIMEITENSVLKDALNTGSRDFTGVAVNKSFTKIALADYTLQCVRVFSIEADLLIEYGNKGSGKTQLKYPDGLAFLDEAHLVIADNDNYRICILDTNTGDLLRTFGCYGNGNGEFAYPCGVYVDNDANILVCDYDNNRVQAFTTDGEYRYQFPVPNPSGVIKHNGLYYVSDWTNSVVHVIEMKDNQAPTTVTTIGGKDFTYGKLKWPAGLAIDEGDNLLVCDYDNRLVHKFTLDGRYVGRSSRMTTGSRYIAVLDNGQVICTVCRKGCSILNNVNN